MPQTSFDDPQATPKAKRPSSPIRIDWASMQSSSSSENPSMHDNGPETIRTPSRFIDAVPGSVKRKRSTTSDEINTHQCENPSIRVLKERQFVYDVSTLMSYRNSLAGLTVFAKIKPEALNANLFSHMGASRPSHPQMRNRGFSELSNRSRQNFIAPPPIFTSGAAGLTERSKQLPVQHQEDLNEVRRDGFVRFLKQHASPPHNRVTAGGRIVPAGPNSPPPMFNFESLTGMAEQKRRNANNIIPLSAPPGFVSNTSGGWPRLRLHGLEEYAGNKKSHSDVSAATSMQNGFFPYGQQIVPSTQHNSSPNLPTSLLPVGAFDDGSFISLGNGIYYRTYWNGVGFVVEPLPSPTGVLPIAASTPMQPPVMPGPTQADVGRGPPTLNPRMPLTNATNRSSTFSDREHQVPKTTQLLDAQQRSLKEELHKLDRHLALHHYQLTHDQKSQFVSQRRSLVEDIDNIRRVREPSAPDLPIIDFKDLAKRAKGRNSRSRSEQQSSSTGDDLKSTSKPIKPNEKPRKALSPNAAPFVPKANFQNPVMNNLASKPESLAGSHLVKMASTLAGNFTASHSNEKKVHSQETSLDRDSDDPAMRIIHNSDVAYASRFEHELVDGAKKYCSKVDEFQEALRRVRQQARLYGCAGGSSKDPAYDAEQDIWWAICDQDPIPLPQDPPDHIVDPRPWDWNDSAFNHRCVSKARPCRAVSKKSASIASKESSAMAVAGAPLESDSMVTNSQLGDSTYQLSARRSSVVPRKSNRALQEVKNPPGPKEKPSKDHNKMTLDNSGKQIVQEHTRQSASPQRKQVEARKQDGKQASDVTPKQPKGQGKTGNKADIPSHKSTQATSIDVMHTSQRSAAGSDGSLNATVQSKPTNAHKTSYREKPRGPKKPKSKQQLRDTNSLRRHRQAMYQAQTAKRPSILNLQEVKLPSIDSEADAVPQSEVSSETTQGSFLSRTSQQLSPRGAARKALQFYDRSRTKSPLKPQPSSSQLRPQRARVNLPALAHAHLKNKFMPAKPPAGDTRPVAPTASPKDSFLRDMLRGTRYSSKKATPSKTEASKNTSNMKQGNMFRTSLVAGSDKENSPAPILAKAMPDDKAADTNFENDVSVGRKAPSSLAASSLQAIAFLPQFDGAGKARASKLQQEHGLDSLGRKAKVNLPQGSSYSGKAVDRSEASNPKSDKSLTSSMFGLDGSGDEPTGSGEQANEAETTFKARAKKVEEYDTRGLTEADFTKERGGVDNVEHYRKVDRFIAKVEKEEQEYMAMKKRENTKST